MEYVSLSDIASYKQGKQISVDKQSLTCEYGMVRFVRIIDFTNPSEPPRYIENPGEQYTVGKKDIVMIRYGSQTAGTVVRGISGVIANNMFQICIKNSKFDINYMYYYLASPSIKQMLMGGQSSSTMPAITFGMLKQIQVPVRPIEEQKKIAALLEIIDKKIEINEQVNDNLLNQALGLFNSQIAALENNGVIGDYCSIKSGFPFKSAWWSQSGVKVIKIGAIDQDKLNIDNCSFVSSDIATKAKEFQVVAGDLLIAMTGTTIGKFAMVPYSEETLLVNQRVGKFFLGNDPVKKLPFIYCTLKQPDVISEIVNRGQGSAQPNISAADIMSIPCTIPNDFILDSFNATVGPMFDLIISNQYENQRLINIRNALLPNLMSGKIDVSDIQF